MKKEFLDYIYAIYFSHMRKVSELQAINTFDGDDPGGERVHRAQLQAEKAACEEINNLIDRYIDTCNG